MSRPPRTTPGRRSTRFSQRRLRSRSVFMRLSWLALPLALLVSAFVAAQQRPPIVSIKVSFDNGKTKFRALQFQQQGKGPYPVVVMLHGDFGLTEWTRQQAERLARNGY